MSHGDDIRAQARKLVEAQQREIEAQHRRREEALADRQHRRVRLMEIMRKIEAITREFPEFKKHPPISILESEEPALRLLSWQVHSRENGAYEISTAGRHETVSESELIEKAKTYLAQWLVNEYPKIQPEPIKINSRVLIGILAVSLLPIGSIMFDYSFKIKSVPLGFFGSALCIVGFFSIIPGIMDILEGLMRGE